MNSKKIEGTQEEIKNLFIKMAHRFPKGQIIIDTISKIAVRITEKRRVMKCFTKIQIFYFICFIITFHRFSSIFI